MRVILSFRHRCLITLLGSFMTMLSTSAYSAGKCPDEVLSALNADYMALHERKEETMWQKYMGLKAYVAGTFEAAEKALSDWRTDPAHLAEVNEALKGPFKDPRAEAGLKQWQAYFEVNTFSDRKLHQIFEDTLKLENQLAEDKSKLKLTYEDSVKGTVKATVSDLRNAVISEANEETRKTAWEALGKLEEGVVNSSFIDIIKKRREFAKVAKAKSFYDYRTQATERMSADEIFTVLDALEKSTRSPALSFVQGVRAFHGGDALKPWNFDQAIRGDLDREIDPYFPFSDSVRRWGASFGGMGINYQNGKILVDLVNRPTKFQNGYIRARRPGYFDLVTGKHIPAESTFTSNAVIGKVGAGLSATKTLVHEGGHAAHFANMLTEALAGSQEEPPTSISGAETHSMFLDHLLYDATWLKRYAVKADGTPMPDDLIEKMISEYHASLAWKIRSMMVVPYFERALYDMPEADLTPKNILKLARDTEEKFLFLKGSGRPVLTVSHFHSAESAGYYHGYVLAELAVWQTREYLLKTEGNIVDNPNIGPLLAKTYWAPGNSIGFSEMIESLTGKPFSADAMGRVLALSATEVTDATRDALKAEATLQKPKGPVNLNAQIIAMDGDTLICETSPTVSFEQMAKQFSDEVKKREAAIAAPKP